MMKQLGLLDQKPGGASDTNTPDEKKDTDATDKKKE